MTLTNALGYLLMASPLIAIAVFTIVTQGFLVTLSVFGAAAMAMGTILIGCYLAAQ